MNALHAAVILCTLLVVSEGGYYKIRPPHPPPPPPPPSLYYGPHQPHHYPPRYHPPYRPSHHRVYQQRYPKPPPPPPYLAWKGYAPSFRAPNFQETFSTPQSFYTAPFLKDEDRGPIHTIPAPNLGPGDRPNLFQHEGFKDGTKKPAHSKPQDLAAILRHGITKVNVPHSPGYQVTEDPAAASPFNTAASSYFAPDPDPEVPAVKIPPTTDPYSLPSNGQVPLDLYLQQQAESNSQYGHYQRPAEQSNTLTPQELFNLLNYQQPSTLQQQVQLLLPQQASQLLSHQEQQIAHQQLAHHQQLTNHQLTHQEVAQQQFAEPQYQSFNYEEQAQQGLYGDLRTNLQTKGYGGIDNEHETDPLEDNDVAGSQKQESYESINANEVVQQQRHEGVGKMKGNLEDKSQFPKKIIATETDVYHSNLIPNNAHYEKTIPQDHKQETPTFQRENPTIENSNSQTMTSVKPENNVQLQKSIQIYENTYANNEDLIKQEIRNMNDFSNDYTDEQKVVHAVTIGTGSQNFRNGENVDFVDAVPYGSRIRPKRF